MTRSGRLRYISVVIQPAAGGASITLTFETGTDSIIAQVAGAKQTVASLLVVASTGAASRAITVRNPLPGS